MSTTVVWLIVVVVVAVATFFAGRYTAPGTSRVRELERQRDESSSELRKYREDVNSHFERTAQLFNDVTMSYRSLYEHLADGSERLGRGPDSPLLETEPEHRRLNERLEPEGADSAPESSAETAATDDDVPRHSEAGTESSPDHSSQGGDGHQAGTGRKSPRMSLHTMQPESKEAAPGTTAEAVDRESETASAGDDDRRTAGRS